MSHVATAPHECEGNLIFTGHGLSPYWTLGPLLIDKFGGYSGEIQAEINNESWTVTLADQPSGIAPRPSDNVGSDRLNEFRIGASGSGERKANFLIQPRFENMRHYETGDQISTPFDHIDASEGINVRFSGSNLEPFEYRQLLPQVVQVLSREGGMYINPDYFAGGLHEMSNITTYERYVRIHRNWSKKLVGRTGVMYRLFTLCATEKGSKAEYRIDNQEIVGKNHRVLLPKADAKRILNGHRYGKQIKHYHPKHVRTTDTGDSLYHPKVGVLLKKSLTGHSFSWSERRRLRREIDETLINILYWSDVPVRVDRTTYVPDDHFEVRDADEPVPLAADPTPEIEANQKALLVTTLRDLCESDIEVLESLVTDGGEQHTRELEENTGRSISTIYRALTRLQGLINNDNGTVTFASKKFEQEIAGIVESTEHQIENAADRVSRILNIETRQAASSAWQKWCAKYAAKIVDTAGDDRHWKDDTTMRVRIDTLLTQFKSASQPHIETVLSEALRAWNRDGRDVLDLQKAEIEWRDTTGQAHNDRVSLVLR